MEGTLSPMTKHVLCLRQACASLRHTRRRLCYTFGCWLAAASAKLKPCLNLHHARDLPGDLRCRAGYRRLFRNRVRVLTSLKNHTHMRGGHA